MATLLLGLFYGSIYGAACWYSALQRFCCVYFLVFYGAACRYNVLQRFCCFYFMGFSMKRHVGTIRCNVVVVFILWFCVRRVGTLRCNVFAGSILWLFNMERHVATVRVFYVFL